MHDTAALSLTRVPAVSWPQSWLYLANSCCWVRQGLPALREPLGLQHRGHWVTSMAVLLTATWKTNRRYLECWPVP